MDSKHTSVVLVVGATGSIGRLAVAEALAAGHEVRALVRDERRAEVFPQGTRVLVGDLTSAETLRAAAADVTGVVFTHGSHGEPPRRSGWTTARCGTFSVPCGARPGSP